MGKAAWAKIVGGTGPTAPLIVTPAGASARGRRKKRPPPPRDDRPRPVPGLILLSIRRFPHPWECDPFATWNVLGLGHWSGFDRAVLLAEVGRRMAG